MGVPDKFGEPFRGKLLVVQMVMALQPGPMLIPTEAYLRALLLDQAFPIQVTPVGKLVLEQAQVHTKLLATLPMVGPILWLIQTLEVCV